MIANPAKMATMRQSKGELCVRREAAKAIMPQAA
jgi:hypothetical protein